MYIYQKTIEAKGNTTQHSAIVIIIICCFCRLCEEFTSTLFHASYLLFSSLLFFSLLFFDNLVMEFEDQDDQEEEMGLPTSYDSLPPGNSSSRLKMVGAGAASDPAALDPHHPPRKPRYRECLKNHAVGIGGHAVDGCGEFIAAGEEGTLDALKCAACNCHRNFHRKETDSSSSAIVAGGSSEVYFHHPHPSQVPQFTPYYRTPAGYLHLAAQHRPLALPSISGGGATHSREDQEDVSNLGGASRKRFRTKFTQEQKDKMLALAEKLGWRIQKHDEEVVQEFCNETGVKRHVLKVWMHNNKHTLGKKP